MVDMMPLATSISNGIRTAGLWQRCRVRLPCQDDGGARTGGGEAASHRIGYLLGQQASPLGVGQHMYVANESVLPVGCWEFRTSRSKRILDLDRVDGYELFRCDVDAAGFVNL